MRVNGGINIGGSTIKVEPIPMIVRTIASISIVDKVTFKKTHAKIAEITGTKDKNRVVNPVPIRINACNNMLFSITNSMMPDISSLFCSNIQKKLPNKNKNN